MRSTIMAQRVQKTRSRGDFERDEQLASETLSNRGQGLRGTKRNVAPEAHDTEPEDYDAQNQAFVGGETDANAKTTPGNYEEDYGPGSGVRGSELESEKDEEAGILQRKGKGAEDAQDFPSGNWSKQKTSATLKGVG